MQPTKQPGTVPATYIMSVDTSVGQASFVAVKPAVAPGLPKK
jgi:hypothetical protein